MPEAPKDAIFSFKPILDRDTADYSLRVEADPAGSEVKAFIFPKNPLRAPTAEIIESSLREAGVVNGIDRNAVKLAASVTAAGTELRGATLAKAMQPVPGVDEALKFLTPPNSDRRKFEALEKDRLAGELLPLIVNVGPGEKIAETTTPTEGKPGMNVFGMTIPAKNGIFLAKLPTAGEGVEFDAQSKTFTATAAGRLVFERETISISGSYRLDGNVNRRTGSIVFAGDIEIAGDVEDSFSVRAKSIKVKGRAGNCLLEAAGDMELNVMNGDYAGALRCGGSLKVETLSACFAEVKGDIHVKNLLSRSIVKCGGTLHAATARIEGGSCTAFKGVEAMNIGAPREDARTRVCAGRCPFTERMIRRCNRELARRERKLRRVQRMIAPYVYDPSKLAKLRPENRSSYERLYGEFKSLAQEIAEEHARIDDLRDYKATQAVPRINVHGILMQGVTICLGSTAQAIGIPVRSPVSIVENPINRVLEFQKLRPLANPSNPMTLNETQKISVP